MKKITASFVLAGLLGCFGSAQAGMIASTKTVALTETDWDEILSFKKFDTLLGILTSIDFLLSGTTSGIARAENKGTSASNLTLVISTNLILTRPDAKTIVIATPLFSEIFKVKKYDKVTDFAGTSGITTATQTATALNSATYSDEVDLLLFSGSGTIDLGLKTIGNSSAIGSGNITSDFSTSAGGYATVTYHYTDAPVAPAADAVIPEPASFAIMGLGLGLLGVTRRRRSINAA